MCNYLWKTDYDMNKTGDSCLYEKLGLISYIDQIFFILFVVMYCVEPNVQEEKNVSKNGQTQAKHIFSARQYKLWLSTSYTTG